MRLRLSESTCQDLISTTKAFHTPWRALTDSLLVEVAGLLVLPSSKLCHKQAAQCAPPASPSFRFANLPLMWMGAGRVWYALRNASEHCKMVTVHGLLGYKRVQLFALSMLMPLKSRLPGSQLHFLHRLPVPKFEPIAQDDLCKCWAGTDPCVPRPSRPTS